MRYSLLYTCVYIHIVTTCNLSIILDCRTYNEESVENLMSRGCNSNSDSTSVFFITIKQEMISELQLMCKA